MTNAGHIIIPTERRLHAERHPHWCPIHFRQKCLSKCGGCERCTFMEDNEICGKTIRHTGLDGHSFPCASCFTQWRGQFGGEVFVDGLVDLAQTAMAQKVIPDATLEQREAYEALTNPDVAELVAERSKL